MKAKGTCGACFRTMSVGSDGLIVRHGWRESGGTRRAGEYGHVFHSGSCFGVSREPFEVSPKCTQDFVEQVLFPMGVRARSVIARLEALPDLVYESKTFAGGFHIYRGRIIPTKRRIDAWLGPTKREMDSWKWVGPKVEPWDGWMMWSIRLSPGMESQKIDSHYDSDEAPSYKQFHAIQMGLAKQDEEAVQNDALNCLRRISSWGLV